MLKKRTLFIVGAGASAEFGMPVGAELADKISTALDIRFGDGMHMDGRGDRAILEALRRLDRNINPYLQKCWRIRDGIQLSYSIDNFLDKHANDAELQLCGRMGIVRCILAAERATSLYFTNENVNNTIKFQSISNTWLVSLFKMLQVGPRADQVDRFFQNCRIITFNYDRCIEHFFYHALQRNYGLKGAQAAQLLRTLELLNVYGRVGALSWEQPRPDGEQVIDFGHDGGPLAELSRNIMTYADDHGDDAKLGLMRSWVSEAETIVFLGMSYQEQNLDLLEPPYQIVAREVFGSRWGISDYNSEAIKRDLQRRLSGPAGDPPAVHLAEVTCDRLLNDYSRALV